MKKVEDLEYPDVIEITSKEQMDKIKRYCKNIYNFNSIAFYLFGRKNSHTGNGQSKNPYKEGYNNYKFEDIIFPDEEEPKQEENLVGRWVKTILWGVGYTREDLDKFVKITEIGKYSDGIGYKVEPKIGNSLTGIYNGFIGASGFELMPIGFTPLNESKQETVFKKNDYIVLLNEDCLNHTANRCYKQRKVSDHIEPYLDNSNSSSNGSTLFKFNSKNWRYATKEEIAEYNKIGKPFDVTTLISKTKDLSTPEYVKWTNQVDKSYTYGKIYKVEKNKTVTFDSGNPCYEGIPAHSLSSFIPATEAEFLLQQSSYNDVILGNLNETTQKWEEKCVNTFGNYVTGVDPYMNNVIEIGDYIQYADYNYYTVESNNPVSLFHHSDNTSNRYCSTLEDLNKIKSFKIVKKKANHQTTVSSKRVDCISPQVNTNLSSLIKIRNSKPLQKLERTRLIIQKTKTIKLN